jgi:excisionase family DNA binding protein
MAEELLTCADVAKVLSVSVRSFFAHVRKHLPTVYVGRSVRFRRADVDAWILARKNAQAVSSTTAQPARPPEQPRHPLTRRQREPQTRPEDRQLERLLERLRRRG